MPDGDAEPSQPETVRHRIGRRIGVHEHGRRPSVELCEYGLEAWIFEVNPFDVREQQYAVEFEDIEGGAQFLQSAIDVG